MVVAALFVTSIVAVRRFSRKRHRAASEESAELDAAEAAAYTDAYGEGGYGNAAGDGVYTGDAAEADDTYAAEADDIYADTEGDADAHVDGDGDDDEDVYGDDMSTGHAAAQSSTYHFAKATPARVTNLPVSPRALPVFDDDEGEGEGEGGDVYEDSGMVPGRIVSEVPGRLISLV